MASAIGLSAHPADACGVKLTIKSTPARKAVAHSANPSDILLLGNPPSRFKRDLAAEGHHVDVSSSAAGAKGKQYAVVVTDPEMQADARANFAGALIVVRSGNEDTDMVSIENVVARRPTRSDQGRAVVAAREARAPIAAGPTQSPDRHIIDARSPTETAPTVATPVAPVEPPPKPVVAPRIEQPPITPPSKPVVAPRIEQPPVPTPTKPAEPKVTPPPAAPAAQVAIKPASIVVEVYFGVGDDKLGRAAMLDAAVKKLQANGDVHFVIEGHADPTGAPEANLALSERRANWVRDYLISAGVDAGRLEVVPLGDTHLRYGRADQRNRRVALVAK